MIYIDDRTGSKELRKYFAPFGVKTEVKRLEFGDFEFFGRGPGDRRCLIGFERKTVDDLLDCMQSKRLSGRQLPGMSDRHDYGYLIIEGIWKINQEGHIQVYQGGYWRNRGFHGRAVLNYVMGLNLRAGLIPWQTANEHETAEFVVAQYRMWTDKSWDEHQSHNVIYTPAPNRGSGLCMRYTEPTPAQKFAAILPGIDAKGAMVARMFKTIANMANATKQEWAELSFRGKDGKHRKLGVKTAEKIWEFIHGHED